MTIQITKLDGCKLVRYEMFIVHEPVDVRVIDASHGTEGELPYEIVAMGPFTTIDEASAYCDKYRGEWPHLLSIQRLHPVT